MRQLLAAAWCLLVLEYAVGAASLSGRDAPYVYNVPVGQPLEQQPGWRALLPAKNALVRDISITQTAVTVKLTTATGDVATFTTPAYLSDATKQPPWFGPTLKARAGDRITIRLTNELVQEEEDPDHDAWGYHNPMDTNLHAHGLHGAPGVNDQATAGVYTGSDNIFVDIRAKRRPSDAPNTLAYYMDLTRSHLPGLHWYHPHKHGSTAIQTSNSHGLIIVEDNIWWLPWNRGSCGILWSLLQSAPDIILDIGLIWFMRDADDLARANPNLQWVSDGNNSYPKNPLCCDTGRTGYSFGGSATSGKGLDLLLVNGGWQPIITLHDSTWHRWRILFSGQKGWFVLQLLLEQEDNTLAVTDLCQMQLIAKDGVYLMQIPRRVPALLMASGSRLEMLVRCRAPPAGKRLVLSATNSPDQFNPGRNSHFSDAVFRMNQDVVAVINVAASKRAQYSRAAQRTFRAAAAASGGSVSAAAAARMSSAYDTLQEEGCTPRRPSYAVDLRDEALKKAGFPLDKVDRQAVNIIGPPLVNGVGCRINNESAFLMLDPNPLIMRLGGITEWSYNSIRFHPIHVHVNPYQLVWLNETAMLPGVSLLNYFKLGDWYDNALIPQIGGATPGTTGYDNVRFRFQPGAFSGYSVVHCHALMHEDIGCIKVVKWECPGYGDVQPANNGCPGFNYPVRGDI